MTGFALFVGDVSWDTTVFAPRMPDPDEKVVVDLCLDAVGGVAANSAAACARAGAETVLSSTVADDAGGYAVKRGLAQLGLTARLETTSGATTRAIVLLDEHGEKRLLLHPGHRMYPSVPQMETLPLESIGWLHTALYDHEASAVIIRRCREAAIPWSIDLEPATLPADLDELAPHLDGCEIAIVNVRASVAIGPDPVTRLRELGVRNVIETLGSGGVRMHGPGNGVTAARPGPLAGPVRDTTGAGDAFAGWFVAERLSESSVELALERAVAAASYSVQSMGTIASYPSRADLLGADGPIERERQEH